MQEQGARWFVSIIHKMRARVRGLWGLTWMNAVAKMTPDPKYFAKKNAYSGTLVPLLFFAKTGKMAPGHCEHALHLGYKADLPKDEPTRITNIAEILNPIRPS